MRIRGYLAAVVAAVAVAASALVGAPGAVPASATTLAPTPVVVGNHLVDSRSGRLWTAHAVNWPSFEYACEQGWGYSGGATTAAAAAAMASWHITAVRLPLNESCWLGLDGSPAYGTVSGYRSAIRSWVTTLNAAGLVVILDLHWSAPAGGYPADGQRPMADARSVTFWQSVATDYAASPSVMFDAFNEPYSRWNPNGTGLVFTLTWDCWRNGGCQAPVENDQSDSISGDTYAVAGMASLVTAIRGAGAAQPVLLGGLDYSNDVTGWLANRPNDPQLVVSWHNYPGQRCQTASCWNSEVAPVAAQVPVIATEFGQTDGNSDFLTGFMTWADAHGIGYSPWAWWVVDASESLSASRYALISDETAFTPKAPSGTAYHSHLAALVSPPRVRPAPSRVGTYLPATASGGGSGSPGVPAAPRVPATINGRELAPPPLGRNT